MKIPVEVRRRIFVRGLNWVGDAVMSTPALRRLRREFPDSHITLMVRPWVAAIHENSPDIDELWVEDDSKAFLRAARRVREGRFDLGIALPNSFRSAMLLAAGGVRKRVGFARGGRTLLLTNPVKVKPKWLEEHQVHYYMHLVEWMFDPGPSAPELVLNPTEASRRFAEDFLQSLETPSGGPRVGIAPGSINSNAKRWPAERFAEVSDRLVEEHGAQVFLLGSPSEADVVGKVASLVKQPVHNMLGRLDLARLIGFMDRMDLFVGNDSGAMHMAAALNVPCVAVFGPTEWKTTSPFSPRARLVRKDVECSPCMLRECPIDHRCMTRVGVDEVLEAAREVMIHGEVRSSRGGRIT